jgi:hypothetical protein
MVYVYILDLLMFLEIWVALYDDPALGPSLQPSGKYFYY